MSDTRPPLDVEALAAAIDKYADDLCASGGSTRADGIGTLRTHPAALTGVRSSEVDGLREALDESRRIGGVEGFRFLVAAVERALTGDTGPEACNCNGDNERPRGHLATCPRYVPWGDTGPKVEPPCPDDCRWRGVEHAHRYGEATSGLIVYDEVAKWKVRDR